MCFWAAVWNQFCNTENKQLSNTQKDIKNYLCDYYKIIDTQNSTNSRRKSRTERNEYAKNYKGFDLVSELGEFFERPNCHVFLNEYTARTKTFSRLEDHGEGIYELHLLVHTANVQGMNTKINQKTRDSTTIISELTPLSIAWSVRTEKVETNYLDIRSSPKDKPEQFILSYIRQLFNTADRIYNYELQRFESYYAHIIPDEEVRHRLSKKQLKRVSVFDYNSVVLTHISSLNSLIVMAAQYIKTNLSLVPPLLNQLQSNTKTIKQC